MATYTQTQTQTPTQIQTQTQTKTQTKTRTLPHPQTQTQTQMPSQYAIVASDIHSDEQALQTLAQKASCPECVGFLYAGDLDTENPMIDLILRNRNFIFIPVLGNCDSPYSYTDLYLQGCTWFRKISILGHSIFLTHGHYFIEDELKAGCDIQISGHTHIPSLSVVESVTRLNPGSASRPRGKFPASYAVLTSETIRVLSLSDNSVLFECSI